MRLRRGGGFRLRTRSGRQGGTGSAMAELDLESDQIRLKCIRKEGFFTVPPEHRVRRGATRAALCGRAGPKRSVALKFEVPVPQGTSVAGLAAASAEIRSRELGGGGRAGVGRGVRGWEEWEVRPGALALLHPPSCTVLFA